MGPSSSRTQQDVAHWLFTLCCVSFLCQAREKYEKALEELNLCTPPYTESMQHAFDQCQNFEERRLEFFKEALLDVKRHLNLIENQRFEASSRVAAVGQRARGAKSHRSLPSYAEVYGELERTIVSSNALEDLSWFSSSYGPGMHMNWPQFEVCRYPGIPLQDKTPTLQQQCHRAVNDP